MTRLLLSIQTSLTSAGCKIKPLLGLELQLLIGLSVIRPVILLSWASAAMCQELGTPDSQLHHMVQNEDCNLKPCSN